MRTVYATVLELRDGTDISTTLEYVGRWISDWYRRQRVSVDALLGTMASGDVEAQPMEGHSLQVKHLSAHEFPNQSLIELIWVYPDAYDKSLGWSTRLLLLRRPSGLLFSLEVAVTGLSFRVAPAAIKLGSPRVVRDVARLRSVFLGGRPYNLMPELVSAEHADVLAAELVDPERPYAIVVVSRRVRDDVPLVDAEGLADRLAGVAKVYELADRWSAFRLTEEVGKPLSCYDGAVRVYWPGFSLQADPYEHPLWTALHLASAETVERATGQIARSLFEAASFRHIEPQEVLAIRQAAEREGRQSNRAAAAEASDTDVLLQDLYDLEDKLRQEEAKSAELARECETLRANAMALASSASWTQALQPQGMAPTPVPTEPATVLDAVRASEATASNLIFLPSAYESAADSPFRQPDRVTQALEAVDEVAAMWIDSLRTGGSVGSLREIFKKKFGFSYADDVSQTSKGKWGGEYQISYEGRDYDISPHITIGAKQADTCLSIHWAWDKDRRKVLIAHVGRHKTNTKA